MKNLGNILKQAQNIQSKMGELQEELRDMEIEGHSSDSVLDTILAHVEAPRV